MASASCKPKDMRTPAGIKIDILQSMNGKSETPNVAIIGRPNVGKSELFNCLTRRKSAIVNDQPGATRDGLYATYERDGQQFLLIDTAGIGRRGTSDSAAEAFRA